MKHRRFRLTVWLPLLAVLALIASALNVATAANELIASSPLAYVGSFDGRTYMVSSINMTTYEKTQVWQASFPKPLM